MFETIKDILSLLGGAGVIILALWATLGGIWRDRIKERQREETEKSILLRSGAIESQRIQTDRYSASQYDVYFDLWNKLLEFDESVDRLWENVTEDEVVNLAEKLRETEPLVKKWSIFFEDDHIGKLNRIFHTLRWFSVGKKHLLTAYGKKHIAEYSHQVKRQIEDNRTIREEWKSLLIEIRHLFKRHLSRIQKEIQIDDEYIVKAISLEDRKRICDLHELFTPMNES